MGNLYFFINKIIKYFHLRFEEIRFSFNICQQNTKKTVACKVNYHKNNVWFKDVCSNQAVIYDFIITLSFYTVIFKNSK